MIRSHWFSLSIIIYYVFIKDLISFNLINFRALEFFIILKDFLTSLFFINDLFKNHLSEKYIIKETAEIVSLISFWFPLDKL